MTPLLHWLTDVTPTPTPIPVIDENMVTPGVVGFVVTFLVAVATVLLALDMTRRIRRVRYRAEVRGELEAERKADGDAN